MTKERKLNLFHSLLVTLRKTRNQNESDANDLSALEAQLDTLFKPLPAVENVKQVSAIRRQKPWTLDSN